MIQPAKRTQLVQEYYFSQKLKEIQELNKTGKNIINLGVGSPDLPPDPKVVSALTQSALKEENHSYQPYVGIAELRRAFAAFYLKKYNVERDYESEVLPLIGSKEGIFYISLTFLNVGDVVLVPNPGYASYASTAKMIGAKPVFYDLDNQNNWYPTLSCLEKTLDQSPKMMWINYPNMPSGADFNPEQIKPLLDWARQNNILICNDNPYSQILTEIPKSIFQVDTSFENVLELNSLSKSHNMAGWRIGCVVGNRNAIKEILKMKSNVDSGMFKPIQRAAIEALNLDDGWTKSLNETYRKRRKRAEKIFELLNVTYDPKSVGMFLWGKVWDSDGKTLSDTILKKASVFITPGFVFGSGGKDYIRISLCVPVSQFEEAYNRIKKAIL